MQMKNREGPDQNKSGDKRQDISENKPSRCLILPKNARRESFIMV